MKGSIVAPSDVVAGSFSHAFTILFVPDQKLAVTMETVGQTNQPSVTTGSPLISPLDHADKALAGSPIG